jgi:hypothetical protein
LEGDWADSRAEELGRQDVSAYPKIKGQA